ncbi:CYTH domain-containing protein [Microbacterium lacus]|uniref:CYTH domain-containing protein n=1 Tax=Microbacterium lacus TaxID=415217 RepID=UPI00384F06DD
MSSHDAASSHEPSRSVEIELKFDVDDGVAVPDWSGVPGVASVSAGEERELDATYLDDPALTLARAGYALRRRTGGPDAGWHIKGPRLPDGGRVELQWPLGEPGVIPEAVAKELSAVADAATFTPLAKIQNTRIAYYLLSQAGDVVAEFADDHVRTLDERTGAERSWHEWEIELGPAGPVSVSERQAFFAAVERAALTAGARAAASASKLARALGY